MCEINSWERYVDIKTYKEWSKKWKLEKVLVTSGQSSIYATRNISQNVMSHYTKIYKYRNNDELMAIYNEYKFILRFRLLIYVGIARGKNNNECYITMDILNYSLESAIINKRDADIHHFDCIQSDSDKKGLKYFILEIAGFIYQLHQHQYIHLDIKQSNCCWRNKRMSERLQRYLIFGNGWKLIDFGLMKEIKNGGHIKLNGYRGTRGWSAPEMSPNASKENPNVISRKTDIWSFGLLIVYIVNGGKNIFDITKEEEKQYDLKDDEFITNYLRNLWLKEKKIDDGLYDLLSKMLRYNQNERISAKQIVGHKYFEEYVKFDREKQIYYKKRNKSRLMNASFDKFECAFCLCVCV